MAVSRPSPAELLAVGEQLAHATRRKIEQAWRQIELVKASRDLHLRETK